VVIKVKRVYDGADKKDGFRILVDRLWPRGLTKEEAELDLWMKNIAPSNELRRWFAHDPKKWDEFKRRYFEELDDDKREIEFILEKTREGTVTLLYASKNRENNNAIALREYIESRSKLIHKRNLWRSQIIWMVN
jgi:uncharacterized protein YeaO (DUF488 family)